jgi:hypothetical protein
MNNDDTLFYKDLFKSEEQKKAKENLKQIDIKNKNRSIKEIEEDLSYFDFTGIED